MKSVFNKIEKEKPREIEFPVLAGSIEINSESIVVLFLSKNTGVVIKGNRHNYVGYLCSNYISVTDDNRWRILSSEESIVLSND